jgi:hypothetical protein
MTAPPPLAGGNNGDAIFWVVQRISQEACPMHKRPIALAQLRHVPRQVSWGDQRLVRDHYLAQLSPQACALSLFLVTVAEAQGLSDYADLALRQRLSLTGTALHPARQARITRGWVAYHRPLSPVLALDAAPKGPPPSATPVVVDDEPVDIKAVFARIWEVLS